MDIAPTSSSYPEESQADTEAEAGVGVGVGATGLLRRMTSGRRRHRPLPHHSTTHSPQSSDRATSDELDTLQKDDNDNDKVGENGDESVPSIQIVGPIHRMFGGLVWRLGGRQDPIQPLRWNKFKWALVLGNMLLTC